MRKIIAGINLTLDGFCDHTAGVPDEEIHQYFAEQLKNADSILLGRVTYQLMTFWQELASNPSGVKSMDDFAIVMNKIPKIVFSNTLVNLDWETATLADKSIEDIVLDLKKQPGKNILVGSRSLIIQLLKLNLIDELQLCYHPVIAGNGMPLFENFNDRKILKLIKTKIFAGGSIVLCYKPANS